MMENLQEFLLNKGYTKAKLHLTKTNHFEIKANINGQKGLFILDTGASSSCVGFEAIEKFNLDVIDSDIKAVGAGDSNMNTQISKRNKIGIGQWKKDKMMLVLFNLVHVNTGLINLFLGFYSSEIGEKLQQQDSDRAVIYLSLLDFTFDV